MGWSVSRSRHVDHLRQLSVAALAAASGAPV